MGRWLNPSGDPGLPPPQLVAILYDAHNHLQDERFGGCQAHLRTACASVGVHRMVVNGSCEADWPDVLALAREHRQVLPSFGYHPWYVGERTPQWEFNLNQFLDAVPSAIGEIGLDRWKPGLRHEGQEEVFVRQLRIAAERNRPASLHCLRAWGRLLELLATRPRPSRPAEPPSQPRRGLRVCRRPPR